MLCDIGSIETKINNEDILALKSPQQELSNDVLHMSIACVHVEQLAIKIFVMHE